MSGKRKKLGTLEAEADLPITPMLDMSFQLLAFFIMTFKPTPTEAQIAMTLPPPQEGGASAIPDPSADKPTKYVARINATENGTIKNITIREDGSAAEPKDVGADAENLMKELKDLNEKLKGKPGKLTLEIDDKLLEDAVVKVLDASIQGGFMDISPVPIEQKKR
jgi:biopolymer transport protein ExbD